MGIGWPGKSINASSNGGGKTPCVQSTRMCPQAHQSPLGFPRKQYNGRRPAAGPDSTRRSGIEYPGPRRAIHTHTMAMTTQDGASLRKVPPQAGGPHGSRIAIAVDDHQATAGQDQLKHIRQPQGIGSGRRPIVVPAHRHHRTVAPPTRQGARIQYIAGMHEDVTAIQHPPQILRHRAMGVGNQPQAQRADPWTTQLLTCQLAPIDPFNLHGAGLWESAFTPSRPPLILARQPSPRAHHDSSPFTLGASIPSPVGPPDVVGTGHGRSTEALQAVQSVQGRHLAQFRAVGKRPQTPEYPLAHKAFGLVLVHHIGRPFGIGIGKGHH